MAAPVLVTGGAGLLAVNWAVTIRPWYRVVLALHERHVHLTGVEAQRIDLNSSHGLARAIEKIRPRLVIHTAGMTSVEACEHDPVEARRVNVDLAANVARACAHLALPLVHISTDHLFSDEIILATEEHPVAPTNVYGRTKAEAEQSVLAEHPSALVTRTNFYGWGPAYRRSFSDSIIDALREGKKLLLFDDVFYTPIIIETLVNATHDLVKLGVTGILHISGDDRLSKYEFGVRVAEHFRLDASLLVRGSLADHPELVRRPRSMGLANRKASGLLGRKLGGVEAHLAQLEGQERASLARELRSL